MGAGLDDVGQTNGRARKGLPKGCVVSILACSTISVPYSYSTPNNCNASPCCKSCGRVGGLTLEFRGRSVRNWIF